MEGGWGVGYVQSGMTKLEGESCPINDEREVTGHNILLR